MACSHVATQIDEFSRSSYLLACRAFAKLSTLFEFENNLLLYCNYLCGG